MNFIISDENDGLICGCKQDNFLGYRVNSIGPKIEPWGTQENMGTASKNQFLIFSDWNLLINNARIQVGAGPDMSCQSERRSSRLDKSMVSKAADKSNCVSHATFPLSMISGI